MDIHILKKHVSPLDDFNLVVQKPLDIQDTAWFLNVVNLFIQYGIRNVVNFWDGYADLIDVLYNFSNFDALDKICASNLKPSQIEDLGGNIIEPLQYTLNEIKGIPIAVLLSHTSEKISYDKIRCAEHEDVALNVPCNSTKCSYYSRYSYFNCGFNSKDPNITSFEVISERMGLTVSEVTNIYAGAVKKIQELSFISSELIEPFWDIIAIGGLCSLCSTAVSIQEDKYKEYNDHLVCSKCLSSYSFAGAKLILKFKRELKDIIQISGKRFSNFQAQAHALGIGVSILQNLYNRVGINRRTSQAASRAYLITHQRPGRTILNSNIEYIIMEVLAAKKIFGTFDSKYIIKIRELSKILRSYNIPHKNLIPLR